VVRGDCKPGDICARWRSASVIGISQQGRVYRLKNIFLSVGRKI
jgi:hypothetical protein